MAVPVLLISLMVSFLMNFSGGVIMQGDYYLSSAQLFSLSTFDDENFTDVRPAVIIDDARRMYSDFSSSGHVEFDEYYNQIDDPRPGFWETSEYMMGRVGVLVIFVESNGSVDPDIERWDEWRMDLVMREVKNGLSWWVTNYPYDEPPLEFLVNRAVGYTSYEPIIRNSTDESLWIPEVLASIKCGSGENYYLHAVSCANEIRSELGTDWAFLIFVVDSLKDDDGMFVNTPTFAYAYLNGPFMVVTYDNDNWGIERMDRIIAHETGHIFGATDEYDETPQNGGYLYEQDSDGSRCIMDNNNWCISDGTRRQIGWVDDNNNGYPDILENELSLTIEDGPPKITDNDLIRLGGTVRLIPYPCRRPYCRSVTINKITPIEYVGDLYAVDGKFDSAVERFVLIYNASVPGWHEILIRFTDALRNLSTSYNQTILYTYIVVTDTRGPRTGRVDVGELQNVDFLLRWAHDYSPVYSGDVVINGLPAVNKGDGWFGITITKNDVGKIFVNVDYASAELRIDEEKALIRKFLMTTMPIDIIFDRVVVYLLPIRERIDVGSYAEISYLAYYEYDHNEFRGSLLFNQPLRQFNVGKYTYTVVDISDELYGLKKFVTNSIDIVFDKVVVVLSAPKTRIDVGSTAEVIIDARYAYDSEPFVGEVHLSEPLTHFESGKYIYRVSGIRDEKHGLSMFESNEAEIIFDKVIITLHAPPRVQVGKPAPIEYSAYYEYDGEKFMGEVLLNRDATSLVVEKAEFYVSEIIDNLYGLKSFSSNKVEVIFDSLTHRLNIDTMTPFSAKICVLLNYISDGSPVTDAEVLVNDAEMTMTSPGEYQHSIVTLSPILDIKTFARANYFDPYIIETRTLMVGNIILYVGAATLIIVFTSLVAHRRRIVSKKGQFLIN